ncbi:MAG: M50 family metallopeptidase [Dehalococcoidia bacterium]
MNERPQESQPEVRMSKARAIGTLFAVAAALALALALARDATSSALLFVLILVGLVVAHEFAHFITAKMFGIYVMEFGIGFPPRIWGKRFGETEYTINWLPIGGFVRLMGEEDPTHPRSLASRPRWQRFIVLASGSVMNLILPIFLFAIAFTIPHEESVGRAIISEVAPGSPAAEAGLQPRDVIYEIDGRDAKNSIDAGRLIRINMGQETDIQVKRGNEFVTVQVTPRWTPPAGQGPTGIRIAPQYGFTETVSQPPWESIPNGLRTTLDTMILARNEFISWFRGGNSPEVAGPVAIAQTTGEVAREGGVSPLLELAALLSINLGIINLLPLPMLDGGRVFFLLIEVVRGGRRIAPEKEAMVHLVGFVVFMALAIVVTFADVSRIVNGESLFR